MFFNFVKQKVAFVSQMYLNFKIYKKSNMKIPKLIILIILITQIRIQANAQDIIADTILANEYYKKAYSSYSKNFFDSCNFYLSLSNYYYIKHIDVCKKKIANVYNFKGATFYNLFNIDSSLFYYKKSLELKYSYLEPNNSELAKININIGQMYSRKNLYTEAMSYYSVGLEIFLQNEKENIENIANVKNLIGILYNEMGFYDKALANFFEVLRIYNSIYTADNIQIANTYNNIGGIYWSKNEKQLAAEYFQKALEIKINKYPTKYISIINSYYNIGAVYNENNQFDIAILNFQKALDILKAEFPHQNEINALSILEIGKSYFGLKNYELALKYCFESLEICKTLYGENNIELCNTYSFIAEIYYKLNDYDNHKYYLNKSLNLFTFNSIEKNPDLVTLYNTIGELEFINNENSNAINSFQKAIYANLLDYNDSCKITLLPQLINFTNNYDLVISIFSKAVILGDTSRILYGIENRERIKASLYHFQIADSLISIIRKNIVTQADKLLLNERVNEIYKSAIDLCYQLSIKENPKTIERYNQLAFYYSEQNKSTVLLQSISNSKALKYSNIPQNLLSEEQDLSIKISNYTNKKNNAEDENSKKYWNNCLFDASRSYDSLISTFENNYPEYYQLKYDNHNANVNDIQNIIDKKTAMISYSISDKFITIFAITKNNFQVTRVALPDSLGMKIYYYRTAISDVDLVYSEISKSTNFLFMYYQKQAFEFYKIFFPPEIENILVSQKIENLIIIPDGDLVKLPFETLIFQKYEAVWTNWQNKAYFSEIPYLIKKYNISYNYSATLFAQTQKNKQQKKTIAKYDWIGFAPVFDDEKTAGISQNTSRLLTMKSNKNDDDNKTRAFLLNGFYINSLPATKTEVEEIYNLFNQNKRISKCLLYNQANEKAIKSNEIQNYKIIHLATHGVVDEFKPELSAVLLAQDTTTCLDSLNLMLGNVVQQNEGFLYQSEIYNLKFNADLVVLSACETGLGKVSKGEGVIGLTRALLYAGVNNLIVSLWQVSDKATQILMVGFYKNYLSLNKKQQKKFASSLRFTKLEMIKHGYHPYLWSSFILIGE